MSRSICFGVGAIGVEPLVPERLELAAFDNVVTALGLLRMAGVPVLTFASTRGESACERRDRRDSGRDMFLGSPIRSPACGEFDQGFRTGGAGIMRLLGP